MSTPKLFKLKAEVAPAISGPRALVSPIAKVRVDTGVFHLDQTYEYQIPEKLSSSIKVGVRVQLPFGSRETEGIVVARYQSSESGGELKSIAKVLSPHPVASVATLHLIDEVARTYASNPWDVVRSAIPPRVASVDKSYTPHDSQELLRVKVDAKYITFDPFVPITLQIERIIKGVYQSGSVLVVVPDETDVDQIFDTIDTIDVPVFKLSSSIPREERYRNFLEASTLEKSVVVGTRSAIFAPINNLHTIIIHKESSPDHCEIRSPGWNSREVAFMRSKFEGSNVILTGFAPSLEVAQLIEEHKIKYLSTKSVVDVKSYTPHEGALLPGRIFSDIRKALKVGPVLFIAPRKGYGNALLCAHCKNIALCDCGGRLSVASKVADPTCAHCGKGFPQWKCSFCQRDKKYLGGRGIDRAAEEIARAFPNIPTIISAGDVIKSSVEFKPSLILATPGSAPQVQGGYCAVVILDGVRFFSHTDLRSQERARELFFESASLISPRGSVLIVIDEAHPITASIARWNVAPLVKRELSERAQLHLPPTVASAILVMQETEGMSVFDGLKRAQMEGRAPHSMHTYGPTHINKGLVKIVIHTSHSEFNMVRDLLHELQRRRSIAKKELFTLRINPYSL